MRVESIDEAYSYLKHLCLDEGVRLIDERDDTLYQYPFAHIQFSESVHQQIGTMLHIDIPSDVNVGLLHSYSEELKDPNLNGFIYTYGHRFQTYFNVNQYDYMIEKLKQNKESRRAVAITIDPMKDTVTEDIPCLQEIILSTYNNKLIMTVLFRSNDIKYAFKYNLYGLLKLQEYFAEKIGVDCGVFNYVGCNVHYKTV